jgi:phosphatidylinositol phospholipase C delta
MKSYRTTLIINIYDLQQYLYSSELNNALDFSKEDSMDYPMTDYFIYSSHNTYLKGDQILGIIDITEVKALLTCIHML